MKISMKKLIILAALGLGVPAVAGAGLHIPGTVVVGANFMSGTLSVRFNPASPPNAYIGAANRADWVGGASTVSFFGYDGTTYFSCYVPPDSALFSAATDIKNAAGAGNGTYLYVSKHITGECMYISSNHASYYSH